MTCVSKLKEMRELVLRISGQVHSSRGNSSIKSLKRDVWCVEGAEGGRARR